MSKKLPGLQRTRRPSGSSGGETPPTGQTTATRGAPAPEVLSETPTADPIVEIFDEVVDIVDTVRRDTAPLVDQSEDNPHRQLAAEKIIKRYAAWATAGGLIPLPYVDVVAVSGTQIRMVAALASLYDVTFSDNLIKTVIAAVIGGAAPHAISAGTVSVFFKSMPGLGSVVGLAGMAGLSNVSTRVLGRLFARHFEAGNNLQDADLKALANDYAEAMMNRQTS